MDPKLVEDKAAHHCFIDAELCSRALLRFMRMEGSSSVTSLPRNLGARTLFLAKEDVQDVCIGRPFCPPPIDPDPNLPS